MLACIAGLSLLVCAWFFDSSLRRRAPHQSGFVVGVLVATGFGLLFAFGLGALWVLSNIGDASEPSVLIVNEPTDELFLFADNKWSDLPENASEIEIRRIPINLGCHRPVPGSISNNVPQSTPI